MDTCSDPTRIKSTCFTTRPSCLGRKTRVEINGETCFWNPITEKLWSPNQAEQRYDELKDSYRATINMTWEEGSEGYGEDVAYVDWEDAMQSNNPMVRWIFSFQAALQAALEAMCYAPETHRDNALMDGDVRSALQWSKVHPDNRLRDIDPNEVLTSGLWILLDIWLIFEKIASPKDQEVTDCVLAKQVDAYVLSEVFHDIAMVLQEWELREPPESFIEAKVGLVEAVCAFDSCFLIDNQFGGIGVDLCLRRECSCRRIGICGMVGHVTADGECVLRPKGAVGQIG